MRRALTVAAGGTAALLVAGGAAAGIINGVPNANQRVGSPANVLADGFKLDRVANGNDLLENPAGIFTRYGYLDDSTLQTDGQPTKTEPEPYFAHTLALHTSFAPLSSTSSRLS